MKELHFDFAVAGGGLAGICAALSAARHGLKVLLVNDRGVLGGNASSEIGVGICGSCHHGLNPAVYSKETGIPDEIRSQIHKNMYGEGLGFYAALDAAFFDLVYAEKNIMLFLNTLVYGADVVDGKIVAMYAHHAISEEEYKIIAPFYADCTGNGALAIKAGCSYKMGREGKSEFNEFWAPEEPDSYTMGNSFYFEVERKNYKVTYKKPDFAYDITDMDFVQWIDKPENFRGFSVWGPHWAYEYGGQKNIIKDSEEIDLENRRLIYGIWDYVKNSGKYPQAENASLKRVFAKAGSRESRRFIGDYMLNENDVENKVDFDDSVAIGGWPMDIHAPLGIYDPNPASNFVPVTGTYNIPFRCLYSKDVPNLMLAGRNISATHIALGSTRVMATCGALGSAIGTAAYVAKKHSAVDAREVLNKHIAELQSVLLDDDQTILHRKHNELVEFSAKADSEKVFENIIFDDMMPLDRDYALALPIETSTLDSIDIYVKSEKGTKLCYSIFTGIHPETYLPEIKLADKSVEIKKGTDGFVTLPIGETIGADKKIYIVFFKNPDAALAISKKRTFGAVTLRMHRDRSLIQNIHDSVPLSESSGYIYCDHHYERERNILFKNTVPMQKHFTADKVTNGYSRPYGVPNIWIPNSLPAVLTLYGGDAEAREIAIVFDNDLQNDVCTRANHFATCTPKAFEIEIRTEKGIVKFSENDNFNRYVRYPLGFKHISEIKITVKETYGGDFNGIYSVALMK